MKQRFVPYITEGVVPGIYGFLIWTNAHRRAGLSVVAARLFLTFGAPLGVVTVKYYKGRDVLILAVPYVSLTNVTVRWTFCRGATRPPHGVQQVPTVNGVPGWVVSAAVRGHY
jgi:hypothetical protein